jgi:hypothetical protein
VQAKNAMHNPFLPISSTLSELMSEVQMAASVKVRYCHALMRGIIEDIDDRIYIKIHACPTLRTKENQPDEEPINHMNKGPKTNAKAPARPVETKIEQLDDWRGKLLAHLRVLIKQADPEVVEEWKWVKPSSPGVPVWSHDGGICTGETYKSVVKLTFYKGAALKDPSGLFNSGLAGNTRRAIDFHEGDKVDEQAFKTLIRAAAALNKPAAR